MSMIKRKYILLSLFFCTLVTDLIHASGFEAPIAQAVQTIGVAVVTGIAAAVVIATEIIRPVDPEKDFPQIQVQEKQNSALPEIILPKNQSNPINTKASVKPEDFQTPMWHEALEKTASPEIVQNHITIRPAPVIPQPEFPTSSSINTTQVTLLAAQKLQQQKQAIEMQNSVTKPVATSQNIQQHSFSQQKQASQQFSQTQKQILVPFEWDESEEFHNVEEQHCSFTQFHAKKRSHRYTDKLLYERSVHFYFEKIEQSSLLKIDPVYQQLTISRKFPANFSVTDKETLLLRHESLVQGLHEAHQEIILLQELDGGSSHVSSDQQNKNTIPPLDPKNPKDKKNFLMEATEKITAAIFDLLKKKFPQFFRDGYGFWNKVKIASVSPAMQKVAEFLNIEKDELDIHIRHIFEPAIRVIQNTNLRINGFHHDCKNLLENSGMFKFVNKEMFTHGYYKATVEIAGKCSMQLISKSFFPAHWFQEQVMQEIHYAIKNMELVAEIEKNTFDVVVNISEYLHRLESISRGLTFVGYTTNTIPIRIVFNPNFNAFITFYPVLGK